METRLRDNCQALKLRLAQQVHMTKGEREVERLWDQASVFFVIAIDKSYPAGKKIAFRQLNRLELYVESAFPVLEGRFLGWEPH